MHALDSVSTTKNIPSLFGLLRQTSSLRLPYNMGILNFQFHLAVNLQHLRSGILCKLYTVFRHPSHHLHSELLTRIYPNRVKRKSLNVNITCFSPTRFNAGLSYLPETFGCKCLVLSDGVCRLDYIVVVMIMIATRTTKIIVILMIIIVILL